MKIMDLKIIVDGLQVQDEESVEDYIEKIQKITNSNYDITFEILHEEIIE